jgi:hypothetical protein
VFLLALAEVLICFSRAPFGHRDCLGFVLDTCCCRPFYLRLAGCMISGRDMNVVVVCSLQSYHVLLDLVLGWMIAASASMLLTGFLLGLFYSSLTVFVSLSMWVFWSERKDGLLFFILDITAPAYCA